MVPDSRLPIAFASILESSFKVWPLLDLVCHRCGELKDAHRYVRDLQIGALLVSLNRSNGIMGDRLIQTEISGLKLGESITIQAPQNVANEPLRPVSFIPRAIVWHKGDLNGGHYTTSRSGVFIDDNRVYESVGGLPNELHHDVPWRAVYVLLERELI